MTRDDEARNAMREYMLEISAMTKSDSPPTPPALPADIPPELLRGVTSKPVKIERGPSRIWTGTAFDVVECVTAVIF